MENLQPQIRFRRFCGDWEIKKFSEVAKSFDYGLNKSGVAYDGYNKYLRITDIDDETRNFSYKDLKSPDNLNKKNEKSLLNYGDIVFARTGASVGKTYIYNKKDGRVFFAGFLIRASINKENNPYFIFTQTLTDKYDNFVNITSQRSGQPGINSKEYKNLKFAITSKEEQEKIGALFEKLDFLIERQEKYLDLNKSLKKSLLQKLFPKEGKDYPELRFSEFSSLWKKVKFSDIYSKVLSGNRLPKHNLKKGTIPYILAQTENNGIYMYIHKNTKDFHGNSMKEFQENSITFSIDNPDAIFLQDKSFFTSNIMRVLYRKDLSYNHQLFFMYSLKKVTKGYDWSLKFSGPVAMNSALMVPYIGNYIDYNEIEKIGSLFKSLDEKIKNEEEKLSSYKDLKKSLLQKIFV